MTRRLLAVTYNEALTLHSLARWKRRKEERQRAKSTFVPEPGRRHMGDVSIERSRALEEHLMDFLEGFPEFDPDEWIEDEAAVDSQP